MAVILQAYLAAGVALGGVPAAVRLSAVSAEHPLRLDHLAAEVGYCLLAAVLWPLGAWDSWVGR